MPKQELENGREDQDGSEDEDIGEKWIRIHPSDRLWLDQEALRLQRERFEDTRVLQRPNVQDTVASVFEELEALRLRLPELRAEVGRLRHRLEACRCGDPDGDGHAPPAGGAKDAPAHAPAAETEASPGDDGDHTRSTRSRDPP